MAHLAWPERRRDEARAPLAVDLACFFVADGRVLSCGTERHFPGALGHGELDAEDPVVPTPMLLPSMVGIRISSVSAGVGFNAAVSAAGTLYTWGKSGDGRLGHGTEEGSLVPK